MISAEEENRKASVREGAAGIWQHVQAYKGLLTLLVVLGLFSAAANGSVPYLTGRFFDSLFGLSQGSGDELAGYPLWAVLLIAWALVQLIANTTDWVTDRLRRRLECGITINIQSLGFTHLLRLPLSYHVDTHINGELSKISVASWRVAAAVRTVIDLAPQMLSVVIGITLAMTINLTLAAVLAAGVLVYAIVLMPMLRPLASLDNRTHRIWNEAWNDAAQAVQQATAVKQSAAETYEERKTMSVFKGRIMDLWLHQKRLWSDMGGYQRLIVFLTQLAIFAVSVGFVANGTITVGELVALNGYALMFFGPFVQLGYNWENIQNGLTSAAHLREVLAIPEERYHPEDAVTPKTTVGAVAFENVSFSYGKNDPAVLANIDFSTGAGKTVALVGESGAGKSTTIALTSGYYFPTEGRVLVDGVDTREWDLTELRKRIAVVPQEVALFNDTLRMNIRYGSFDATDEEVERAAKQAHIDEFIHTLPSGYDTLVGERGVKLSVGQKQRIAIARAILRDPEILILDEPTSALDSKTEQLITASLESLMRGRTTFIIAHRLSTVRKADTILVLEQGRIVEQGSHDELMKLQGGTYRRLYELHIGLGE